MRGRDRPFLTVPAGLWVVLACCGVQRLTALPSYAWSVALAAGGLAVFVFVAGLAPGDRWPAHGHGRFNRLRSRPARDALIALSLLAAASGWAMLRAQAALAERLAPEVEGVALRIVGVVEDMPQRDERGVRFRFHIERCSGAGDACPKALSIRLGWQAGRPRRGESMERVPEVRPGERWQFNVKLRRPHATANPGVFDAELRALEDGIAATGSVRRARGDDLPNQRIDAFVPSVRTCLEHVRMQIRDALVAAMADRDPVARGVVIALVVGDQAAIPGQWWEVFNQTGIGHLVSISGLHITMLAGLAASVVGALWRSGRLARGMLHRPLAGWLPRPHARWMAGVSVAFAYSALAGWGIPAQRTCWMLACAGGAMMSGRSRAMPQVLCTAAALVCLIDPWAPMAAGFWLSFAAVAAIVWFGSARAHRSSGEASAPDAPGWRRAVRSALHEGVRTQIASTVSLVPLGVVFFASISLVSPIANAVAIPVISSLVTPLSMAGAALALFAPPLAEPVLAVACTLTGWVLTLMQWLRLDGAGSVALAMPGPGALALAIAACAVLLAPLRVPGRWAAVFGLVPVLVASPALPQPGELRITAIDIGQGMAVLVETGARRLLFDTGPTLGPELDAGSRTIVPWLRSRGIEHLDALVVSHLDDDHSGGARSLLRAMRVDWMASSIEPEHAIARAASRLYPCMRGERWRWGDANFEWLHPGPEPEKGARSSTNARSCVLRVASPAGVVLLPGDLETPQEKKLLTLYEPSMLAADVLVAPHHGSTTSSSEPFLRAVRPRWAIFQVGYRSRFGHPHPKVMRRYLDLDVVPLRSDEHGAITLTLRPGREPQIERFRVDAPPYWRVRVDPARAVESEPEPEV